MGDSRPPYPRRGDGPPVTPRVSVAALGRDGHGLLGTGVRVTGTLGRGKRDPGVGRADRRGEDHAVDGASGAEQRAAGVARLDRGPDLVDLPGDLTGLVDVRAYGALGAADPRGD